MLILNHTVAAINPHLRPHSQPSTLCYCSVYYVHDHTAARKHFFYVQIFAHSFYQLLFHIFAPIMSIPRATNQSLKNNSNQLAQRGISYQRKKQPPKQKQNKQYKQNICLSSTHRYLSSNSAPHYTYTLLLLHWRRGAGGGAHCGSRI